jgi:Ca2+-binding RTX toxin-like protein
MLAVEDPLSTNVIGLYGNNLAQTIVGNAGNNEIQGRGGADVLMGLAGNDSYYVTDAQARVLEAAGQGQDTVYVSLSYTLEAGQYIEGLGVTSGVNGPLSLTGNELAQTIQGNNAANTLIGGGGADRLIGLGGDDTYYVTDSGTEVWERNPNQGFDVVYSAVNFTLAAYEYVEILFATDAAATTPLRLIGNNLSQVIRGNAGANVLADGGGAGDILSGIGGDDTYGVTSLATRVFEAAGDGYDSIYTTVNFAIEPGQQIEFLAADGANLTTPLTLAGNELAQIIGGNAGDNLIRGGGGADTLDGREGNDTFFVSDSATRILEAAGQGFDWIYTTVSFSLEGGVSVEVLAADGANLTTPLTLAGNELAQVIGGNAGDNLIRGGGGADVLDGREGNDTFFVSDSATRIIEGADQGYDWVYTTVSFALEPGQSVEVIAADGASLTTPLTLAGNELAQIIGGNAGDNLIRGGGGADTLDGREGNDTFFVSDSATRILEAQGQGYDWVYTTVNYTLGAGVSVEVLAADGANLTTPLTLIGNELAQIIGGNAGANYLDGGAGADFLDGREGADSYAFTTALGGGNVDQIYWFEAGTDKILLGNAVFGGTPGALPASVFVTGPAALDADDRIIYDPATGKLWFDADGSGSGAAVQFATLDAGLPLHASDFQII